VPETTAEASPFQIRAGTPADAAVVLDLFDAAVRWLVSRGLTGQWGTEPFSADPKRVAAAEGWASGGGLRICERDGEPVGALVVGEAPAYVPAATEPEVYVVVLVTARTGAARGAGRALLAAADREARARGVDRLRVDCFAGHDGALVRFYESAGYERLTTFFVDDWPGQLLQRRLAPPTRQGPASS
jgi:GNAT superfamily N-acetyltransferase